MLLEASAVNEGLGVYRNQLGMCLFDGSTYLTEL